MTVHVFEDRVVVDGEMIPARKGYKPGLSSALAMTEQKARYSTIGWRAGNSTCEEGQQVGFLTIVVLTKPLTDAERLAYVLPSDAPKLNSLWS